MEEKKCLSVHLTLSTQGKTNPQRDNISDLASNLTRPTFSQFEDLQSELHEFRQPPDLCRSPDRGALNCERAGRI